MGENPDTYRGPKSVGEVEVSIACIDVNKIARNDHYYHYPHHVN